MSYPASVIAFAFVKKGISENKPVTQMKLQKMVYFAHGYQLAKYGIPLVEEEFEAWKFGPVIPSIYKSYKFYGSAPIVDTTLISDLGKLEAEVFFLNAMAVESVNYSWEVTKDITASNLSAWSHKDGSPWAEAFIPDIKSIPIKNKQISQYFTDILAN